MPSSLSVRSLALSRRHRGIPCTRRAGVPLPCDCLLYTSIDKSNVRYVLHHNMPGSIEAYYQEAGRAGRDGEPSTCLLYWSDGDVSTCRFFIEQESGNEELSPEEAEAVRASRRRLLAAMTGYCHTTGCLRRYILDYFGEQKAVSYTHLHEAAGVAGEKRRPCARYVRQVAARDGGGLF